MSRKAGQEKLKRHDNKITLFYEFWLLVDFISILFHPTIKIHKKILWSKNLNVIFVFFKEYGPQVQTVMQTMGEKEMSFELIEAILKYIKSMSINGAVLVFLPGWNIIFALMKWLQQHNVFGGSQYR